MSYMLDLKIIWCSALNPMKYAKYFVMFLFVVVMIRYRGHFCSILSPSPNIRTLVLAILTRNISPSMSAFQRISFSCSPSSGYTIECLFQIDKGHAQCWGHGTFLVTVVQWIWRRWCCVQVMYYYSDLTLSQEFQSMAAQLSMKAALPLAKILPIAPCILKRRVKWTYFLTHLSNTFWNILTPSSFFDT